MRSGGNPRSTSSVSRRRPSYGLHFDDQDKRVEAYRKEVGTKIRRIEAALKRARVGGTVVIDAKWAPISELILARAKRVRADLLLVHAKSGRLAGFMGGSVARQIARRLDPLLASLLESSPPSAARVPSTAIPRSMYPAPSAGVKKLPVDAYLYGNYSSRGGVAISTHSPRTALRWHSGIWRSRWLAGSSRRFCAVWRWGPC